MNELKFFSNTEFGELGVMVIDGKEYFPATQCAKILGYTNPQKAIKDHCRGDGVTKRSGVSQTTNQYGVTSQQVTELNYIDEGNLYRLIVHSKLPAAEKFERWVFDEVLPSIRQNGGYAPNLEELITKTAAAVVSEVIKQVIPILTQNADRIQATPDERLETTVKRFKYLTPSKISTLPPQIRETVDEMICSAMYSCQQIANFITDSSGMTITSASVNRYAHNHFWDKK